MPTRLIPMRLFSLNDPDATNGTRANGITTQGQNTGNYAGSTFTTYGFLGNPPSNPVPEFSSVGSFGFLMLLGTDGILVTRKRSHTTEIPTQ